MRTCTITAAVVLASATSGANAQSLEITWYSIDGGGGVVTGGGLSLVGAIGQHDAGPPLSGGAYTVTGGFITPLPPRCPADWTGDGGVNSADFFAFLSDFFNGDADVDSDGATTSQDFFQYLTHFFAGC